MAADTHVGSNKFGLDAEMYTGKDTKDRGESMVSKHLEKMQAEKENLAIEKLSALMPQMGAAVRVVALRQAVFDVDTAINLLRRFQTENEEPLKALQKKRSKLQQQVREEEQAAKDREASSSGSGSDDDSGSDSGSGSGSEEDRKRKRRSKRSKSGKRKRSGDKDKKRKKRKKDGKEGKAKGGALTAGANFGKYGIIRETDAAAKSSEFILWALEVKKVDIETLPRTDERELFRDYIEDYNTGTLPHRKYYNLEAYNKYKEAKAAAKGIKKTATKAAVDDEQELRKQRAEEAAKLREQRLQEALKELKYSDKAKDMKEQEMLRLQMQAAYKAGDLATAERIMKRLAPDEPKK